MSVVSSRIVLEETNIGTPVVTPVHVTARLFADPGVVEPGTPVLRLRLGPSEYELRVRFRCFLALRVRDGQLLEPGDLLGTWGADGEEILHGLSFFEPHAVEAGEGGDR